jgi:hypothetical protein
MNDDGSVASLPGPKVSVDTSLDTTALDTMHFRVNSLLTVALLTTARSKNAAFLGLGFSPNLDANH